MKNTEICMNKYIKSEVIYRKILRKINILEYQIVEVKKMTNIFWDIRLKKPELAKWFLRGDDLWWKTASDDILGRWKEIHESKDEIDWAIRDMLASVEREEEEEEEEEYKKYKKTRKIK